jgi:hypothetical protein
MVTPQIIDHSSTVLLQAARVVDIQLILAWLNVYDRKFETKYLYCIQGDGRGTITAAQPCMMKLFDKTEAALHRL